MSSGAQGATDETTNMAAGEQQSTRQARIVGSATGQVSAGVYVMTVSSFASTTLVLASRERRVDPPEELVRALQQEPPDQADERRFLDRANAVLDTLTTVTDEVERLTGLVRAFLEGRLPSLRLLAEEADDGLGLVRRLYQTRRFAEAIEVGRPLCRAFVLTLRWTGLVETLLFILNAARALADSEAIAWAEHELGTLHQVVGDVSRAKSLLKDARDIRTRIGDEDGLKATNQNLRLLRNRRAGLPLAGALSVVGLVVVAGVGLGYAASIGGGRTPLSHSASTFAKTRRGGGEEKHRGAHGGRGGGGGGGGAQTTTAHLPPPAGIVEVVPASVAFGSEQIGRAGPPETVTMTNHGRARVSVASVKVSGGAAGDFSVSSDHCSGSSLAYGGTCTVSLTFAPTALGQRVAALTFAHGNGVSARPVAVSGIGTSTQDVAVSPAYLALGSVPLGQTSDPEVVTLSNSGGQGLTVRSVELTGVDSTDYSITSDQCSGHPVPPGGSCSVRVTFRPGSVGARTATLAFADDFGSGQQSVAFSGVGTSNPIADLTPTQLSFKTSSINQTGPPLSTTLANDGNAPLAVGTVTIAGAESSAFAVSSNGCSNQSLAPDDSCTIAVTFTPGTIGPATATLTIADNANPATQQVSLTGDAAGSPRVSVQPGSLNFGSSPWDVTTGALDVTVTDTGNAALAMSSDGINGANSSDFAVSSDRCASQTIAPGATCMIAVTFKPTAVGSRTATLNLGDNASGAAQQIALTGTGTGHATDRLHPEAQRFSAVEGHPAPAVPIKLANTGTAPLIVQGDALEGQNPADFAVSNDTCSGHMVAPGTSCTLDLSFTSTSPENYFATLTFTDNVPSMQDVKVEGTFCYSVVKNICVTSPPATNGPATGFGNIAVAPGS